MPRNNSGRSPQQNSSTNSDDLSVCELKQLIIDIKRQNDQILAAQTDILQRLVSNSEEIAALKAENTELKVQINFLQIM